MQPLDIPQILSFGGAMLRCWARLCIVTFVFAVSLLASLLAVCFIRTVTWEGSDWLRELTVEDRSGLEFPDPSLEEARLDRFKTALRYATISFDVGDTNRTALDQLNTFLDAGVRTALSLTLF